MSTLGKGAIVSENGDGGLYSEKETWTQTSNDGKTLNDGAECATLVRTWGSCHWHVSWWVEGK